jgi:uroporphyrinogen III methyltransferase / synthase
MSRGFVSLVGAGPGDPGLITRKGLALIESAEVLVYDSLVSAELVALAPKGCSLIFAGKRAGQPCVAQSEIDSILVREGLAGRRVVRLKGGDPFVFGRGGEEASALAAAGIPFEVVPGVTSALAAAAYSGIPLTHRAHNSAVVLVTGHGDPANPGSGVRWADYARLDATLCIYMGVRHLPAIAEGLVSGGMAPSMPAAVIENATSADHRCLLGTISTLAELAESEKVGSPAMIIVGEVAAYAERLAWFRETQVAALLR